MTAGLFLLAVVTALVPTAAQLWLLSVLFFLSSVASGMVDVGGNTLLVWVHGKKVGPFMNGLHFSYGIGATIAPLLIVPIVNWSGGIPWVYWTLALLTLPVAALLSRTPSPAAITESETPEGKETDAFLVGLITVFLFLYVGAQIGFGNWIATYAQASTSVDDATAAYLTSAYWGAFTLGRLIAIPIATIFTPRRILWMNLIGALASLSLIVGAPGTTWALWVGSMGLGLALASTFPTMFLLAETYLPMTGKLTSTFFIGISLGSMGLPWLIGQLFDRIRPNSAMVAILIDVLLATALFVTLLVHIRRRSLQSTG